MGVSVFVLDGTILEQVVKDLEKMSVAGPVVDHFRNAVLAKKHSAHEPSRLLRNMTESQYKAQYVPVTTSKNLIPFNGKAEKVESDDPEASDDGEATRLSKKERRRLKEERRKGKKGKKGKKRRKEE